MKKKAMKKWNMIMEGAISDRLVGEILIEGQRSAREVFQAGNQWKGPEREHTWLVAGMWPGGGCRRRN